MPYRTFSIPQLEGLNQDENPETLLSGELKTADNCARRGNMVGTRPGVAALGSGEDYENAIDEANAIRGAYEYRQNFDQGRRIIVIADHTTGSGVFYDDATQLTTGTAGPTISAAEDYIYSFATHQNTMIVTGGPPGKTQVQTEDMWTWDGDVGNAITTLTLTDKSTTATLRPKFIKTWRNWVLINGLQQTSANLTGANNPAVTRYCNFGQPVATDASWPDGNTIGFSAVRVGLDSYGENFSTGFGEYTDNEGDFLILLSNRQLAAVKLDATGGNDFIVTDAIANGCVHQRAFVNLGLDAGDAIYVSDRGIHSLRQSQQFSGKEDTFLSWKIRTFFNSLNKNRIHHTCGAYDAQNGRVVFAFSTGSNTSHDSLMCLDVKEQDQINARNARWYGPWKLGGSLKVNHIAYMRDANDNYHLYVFTTSGRVLRFNEDTHADLATNGYSVLLETRDNSMGSLAIEKGIGDTFVEIGTDVGGYGISMRTVFNFGRRFSNPLTLRVESTGSATIDSAVVGEAVLGNDFVVHSTKAYTSGSGHTIAYKFQHGGTNEPFYIGRIDTQISASGEDAGEGAG